MRSAPVTALLSLVLLAACPEAPPTEDAGPDPDPIPADAGPLSALRINEAMSRNDSTLADGVQFDDWIELLNAGDAPLDVGGFALTDDPANPAAFLFQPQTLEAGGFLIVFADGEVAQGPLHAPFRLGGGGESLSLRDPSGRVVDTFTFGELAVDQSAGRSPDGEGDPVPLRSPTPGSANDVPTGGGAPAAEGVVINELLALNVTGFSDLADGPEDWVELLNTSATAQDIGLHHLSDSPDAPFLYTFPAPTVLEPGGYALVFLDGQPAQGADHAGFGLAVAGDSILFSAPDGTPIDSHGFGAQTADVSLARQPDGTGEFAPDATPTPLAPND